MSATEASVPNYDGGEWVLTHPDELILTLWLPGADPLGFPESFQSVSYFQPAPDTIESLSGWDQPFDLTLKPGTPEPTEPGVPAEAAEPLEGLDGNEPVNLSNKLMVSSSILVHHVTGNPFARSGMDVSALTAQAATRRGARIDVNEVSILNNSDNASNSLLEKVTRQEEVGTVTVFEAAVPLRVFGEPPPEGIWSQSTSAQTGRNPEPPSKWRVLETSVATPLNAPLLTDRIQNAVDAAIADIRSLQSSYYAVTLFTLQLVTREILPPLVAFSLRKYSNFGSEGTAPIEGTQGWLATGGRTAPRLHPELSDSQIRAVPRARSWTSGEGFSQYLDLRREAFVALEKEGDTRLAALMAGLSSESLLDDMLMHLQWELALTPEAGAREWKDMVSVRVRSQFHPHLSGDWDLAGSGPIAAWSKNVAFLRNRVAHTGYTPTLREAELATEALDGLVEYLCRRVCDHKILRKFPRTALTCAGRTRLKAHNAYTSRIRALDTIDDTMFAIEAFSRWRTAHIRIRGDIYSARIADANGSELLAIRHPDQTFTWCLYDREVGKAARVEIDWNSTSPHFNGICRRFETWINQLNPPSSFTQGFHPGLTPPFSRIDRWVEDYHLVPMRFVMVDGSDLTR